MVNSSTSSSPLLAHGAREDDDGVDAAELEVNRLAGPICRFLEHETGAARSRIPRAADEEMRDETFADLMVGAVDELHHAPRQSVLFGGALGDLSEQPRRARVR